MCGITGIIWPDAERPNLEERLIRMQSALGHRGPDDQGRFIVPNRMIGLAHTRLSILDLSPAGHQPMADAGTGNTITYNGEIYNYRELREELNAKSTGRGAASREGDSRNEAEHQWCSQTDTEVILKAYARWRQNCLHRLRGMFALALWDDSRKELLLARDPFGIKPLYYYQGKNVFLFASEIRALLASELVPRKLCRAGMASYLEFGSVQDPLTIVDGVRSLPPGHSLIVKSRQRELGFAKQNYASDLFQYRLPPLSTRSDAVAVLREKLEESVRYHLVSDVPVAAFLSGGIDSSAVVGLMRRVSKQPPRTFTVVFSEKQFSEQKYAHLAARRYQTEHQDIQFSEAELLKILPAALGAMDQPTMDGINTFVIAKAVKDAGVTVALSGLGGDELFAGYPSFRRARQLQKMALLPHGLRNAASALGRSLTNGSVRHKKFWNLVASDCSAYLAYAISRQLFDAAETNDFIPDLRASARSALPVKNGGQNSGLAEPTNAVSLHELQGYLANTLLRDTDQMSMAHALEIRVPFIDSVVSSYVLGLPGKWKVDGKRPKPLLLDALGDMLPEGVWHRPKMGFTVPLQRWMRSTLQPELDAALSDESALSELGLNPRHVSSLWQSFKKHPQQQSWARPWALYVLAKWCDINAIQS